MRPFSSPISRLLAVAGAAGTAGAAYLTVTALTGGGPGPAGTAQPASVPAGPGPSRTPAVRSAGGSGVTAGGSGVTAGGSAVTAAGPPWTITDVGGPVALWPGRAVPLELQLSNPNAFAITVTALGAAAADQPACPGSTLRVDPLATAGVPVPAGGTAVVAVTAELDPDAPRACAGRAFDLTFTGSANRS